MTHIYDVLVVGGGPAGLTAARVASELGADVLLLEKKSYFGTPYSRWMKDSPYLKRVFKAIGMGSVLTPVYGFRVYDYKDEEYQEIPAKGWGAYNVDAVRFCQGLAWQAAEAGARLELGQKVLGFIREEGTVVGVHTAKENYRSRVVLCADGLASILIGLSKGVIESPYGEREKLTTGINMELVGVEDIEPGWQEIHPWENDLSDGLQLLLPLDRGFCGASFDNLEHFHEMRKGSRTLSRKLRNAQIAKRFVAVDRVIRGSPMNKVSFDGLLFCGEAAGTHSGLRVMISADKAAQIATQAVTENNVSAERLSEYDKWCATSPIMRFPGIILGVLIEDFDLDAHCKEVQQRLTEMSKFDL